MLKIVLVVILILFFSGKIVALFKGYSNGGLRGYIERSQRSDKKVMGMLDDAPHSFIEKFLSGFYIGFGLFIYLTTIYLLFSSI